MNEAIKNIPIEIRDGDLILKQLTVEDAQKLFELIDKNREHLSQYGENTSEKYPTPESVLKSIQNPSNPDRLRFSIQNQGEIVGSINLTPQEEDPTIAEIGYYLGKDFTGKGLATRAAQLLTNFAINNLGYKTLFGTIEEKNLPSAKVLIRAGYKEEKNTPEKRYYYRV